MHFVFVNILIDTHFAVYTSFVVHQHMNKVLNIVNYMRVVIVTAAAVSSVVKMQTKKLKSNNRLTKNARNH